jgi:predicted deacylase
VRATVTDIDLESFGPGRHDVWLHLVDDALGLPIRIPVLVFRGAREGPALGLTAAVHGDEVNGAAVIHAVFDRLDPTRLRGTVLGVPVVNVPAFHAHRRRTPHGFDLNHYFPGSRSGNDIQIYAHRLLERFVRHVDVLIDLHTASQGRANSLYVRADMERRETARMAYLQRPQIILHNPASDGTLRGAASELGVPAITLEVGNPNRFQRDYIRRSVVGVRAVLADQKMLPKRSVALGDEPTICSESSWMYTHMGGLLRVLPAMTDLVVEGDVVAELVDPFGKELHSYTAPFDGIVIGKAVDPVAATGARILHLGKLADARYPFVRRTDA